MRILMIAACLQSLSGQFASALPAPASDHCYPISELRRAYGVVVPASKQIIMRGSRANRYLQEYNQHPPQSNIVAEELLLVILPNDTAIMIPIGAGIGCKRVVIDPRLHRLIMIRLGRDDT